VLETVLGLYNYWIVIFLMMAGFFTVIARGNLAKKVIGLNIFQTSVFLLYITMGYVEGGTAPIVDPSGQATLYTNPLPSVLILTAIVVGVATTALGLALAVRIRESHGTLEEDEILAIEDRMDGEA
jgi:multicomponent Na+:H+ antiporter subunit C